ncbi:uncharacterized protein LOC136086314 [Hydra vulgaris]|uniref:Uncharacterized protein LOC136086314 n=1 Tax=Hydra vulgaris TaxID=6087 RepID=A0ABM4CS18_HYDVU
MPANLDPMVFPLFYSKGDSGLHNLLILNLERASLVRNYVTSSQFYSYKPSQYAVDAYVKIEGQRHPFICNSQNKLRMSNMMLHEHVNNLVNYHFFIRGLVVILPSTYVEGPSSVKKNFEDAMAIIKKYDQTANDRPDLVNRVFKLKFNNLLNDIFKHAFREVVTYVHVIEFLIRGLPHVHNLLHFANDDKLETAHDINNLISAEVPGPIVNRDLYNVVKTCMIHIKL